MAVSLVCLFVIFSQAMLFWQASPLVTRYTPHPFGLFSAVLTGGAVLARGPSCIAFFQRGRDTTAPFKQVVHCEWVTRADSAFHRIMHIHKKELLVRAKKTAVVESAICPVPVPGSRTRNSHPILLGIVTHAFKPHAQLCFHAATCSLQCSSQK